MDDQIIVYPVQIRADLTVKLLLPADLTVEEAVKIARVVKALAEQPTSSQRQGQHS